MDLVNRYLQAVRFWLPASQRDDISAELSEDLRSQIEEKESGLGRKLNEAEVAEVLKERGRPVLVANRFRPPQYLIGPVLFPIYVFVIKIVSAFYMVPWIAVWIGINVSRVVHHGGSFIELGASFWTEFWPMAFFLIGSITTVFAVLERVQAKSGFLEKWDPRKLPPVRDPNRIPITNSVIEIVANTVFCIWLVAGAWYQTSLHFAGVNITLAPVWKYFFAGFLGLAMFNTVASTVNLFRPYWTWQRAALRTVADCFGSILFCGMLKANIFATIMVVSVPAAKTAEIAHAINWWAAKMFPVGVVACVVIVVLSSYRIYRVRSRATRHGALNVVSGVC